MARNPWGLILALCSVLGCGAPDVNRSITELGWHACERDDKPAACRPKYLPNAVVISWRDGDSTRLECESTCEPNGILLDGLGARWVHELFIQGNSRYTQAHTGSSIFVPLRPLAPALDP